jgi:hypothetical protein
MFVSDTPIARAPWGVCACEFGGTVTMALPLGAMVTASGGPVFSRCQAILVSNDVLPDAGTKRSAPIEMRLR